MYGFRIFLVFIVSAFFCANSYSEPIRMGVSSRVPNANDELVQKTIETLKIRFKDQDFEVVNYSLLELERAIKNGEIDFFHSSAGLYRRLTSEGVRDLVALSSPRFPDPNQSEGTAFIVRSDRKDINNLSDLKGKTLVANSKTGFSGYLIGQHELQKHGFDPENFYSNQIFVGEGNKMKYVLQKVASGEADVGYLRLCYLEDMAKKEGFDPSQFKVIGDKKNSSLTCAHSTSLYPSWTISTTPKISPENARLLLLSLLEISPSENGAQWSPASDYHSVDQLLKDLKIGPWEYLRQWTLERFLKEYWPWFMLAGTCLLGLIAHSVRSQGLIKKRTNQLESAHLKQTELLKKAREMSSRLDKMQKIGAIGQMSSMLAHELRQPISTIQLYGRGMLRFMEGGPKSIEKNSEKLQRAVGLINDQCVKMNKIIEKVRSYAKSTTLRRIPVSVNQILNEAVKNYEISKGTSLNIKIQEPQKVTVLGDPLELELVFINLLRNAVEACTSNLTEPSININLFKANNSAIIEVKDESKDFADGEIHELFNPLNSSKDYGMGLGLQIVNAIIESHGGSMNFYRNEPKGLVVRITLPLWKEKNDE